MFIIFLIPLLFFISCSHLGDQKVIIEGENYYKVQDTKINKELYAIRDKAKNLIRDEELAKQRLQNFSTLSQLEDSKILACSGDYKITKMFHEIIKFLENKNITSARERLIKLQLQCKNIEYQSQFYYLMAYTFHLQGNFEKRDFYLAEFSNKADSVFPAFSYQTNSATEKHQLYESYYEHAKSVLTGADLKLKPVQKKHLEIARYRDRSNSFFPGFQNESGKYFIILPYYSTITNGGIQMIYNYATPSGEFIPQYSYDDFLGSMLGVTYRKSLTQTIDRKHQTGINVKINQWKEYRYYRNPITNKISNFEITNEGVGGSLGYGGTYQFSNSFYYLYQGRVYSYKNVGTTATSLLGYSFGSTGVVSLEYGLYNNHSIAGLRFGIIHTYQDLSSDTFNFVFNMAF